MARAYSKEMFPEAGDEVMGTWPRERLIKMNVDFVERLERAIALGLEPPQIVTQNGCVSLAR
jgi:hypothetical protein